MRIKRFNESLDSLTEQEIRDCFIDLYDAGYSVKYDVDNYISGYNINIEYEKETGDFLHFKISLIIEPILAFINYLKERFKDFSYKISYLDKTDEWGYELDIEDFLANIDGKYINETTGLLGIKIINVL